MCKFLCGRTFYFFRYVLRVGLVGHIIILCSTFWRTAKLFSTAAAPFYILTSNNKRSDFSTPLPMLTIFRYFLFYIKSHPSGCKVLFHCCFDLHFLKNQRSFTSFHTFVEHLDFGEMTVQVHCQFFNWVVCLFAVEL